MTQFQRSHKSNNPSLFLAYPDAINMKDSFDKTPIERIVSLGDTQTGVELMKMLMKSSVVFNKKNMQMKEEKKQMKANLDETRDELTEFRDETVRLSKMNASIEQQLRIEKRRMVELGGEENFPFSSTDHVHRAEDEREVEEYQITKTEECVSHNSTSNFVDISETVEYKEIESINDNLNVHISNMTEQFNNKISEKAAEHNEKINNMESQTKTRMSQMLVSLRKSYDEEKLFWDDALNSVEVERDSLKKECEAMKQDKKKCEALDEKLEEALEVIQQNQKTWMTCQRLGTYLNMRTLF